MKARVYTVPANFDGVVEDEDALFDEDLVTTAPRRSAPLASPSSPRSSSPDSSFSQLRLENSSVDASMVYPDLPDLSAADANTHQHKEGAKKLAQAQALIEEYNKRRREQESAAAAAASSAQQRERITAEKMERARLLIESYRKKSTEDAAEHDYAERGDEDNHPIPTAKAIIPLPVANVISAHVVEGVSKTRSDPQLRKEHEIYGGDASVESEDEYVDEALPPKISRRTCLDVLTDALKIFGSLDDITAVHQAFTGILSSHAIQDQEWFQACAESYVLDSERGDPEMQAAMTSVMTKVQNLQALSGSRQEFTAAAGAAGGAAATTVDASVYSKVDKAEYWPDDGEEKPKVDPKLVLAGNLRRLGLIQGILSGDIVTERQRRRREKRAQARLKRAKARTKRLEERAQKANRDAIEMEMNTE